MQQKLTFRCIPKPDNSIKQNYRKNKETLNVAQRKTFIVGLMTKKTMRDREHYTAVPKQYCRFYSNFFFYNFLPDTKQHWKIAQRETVLEGAAT